MAASSARRRTTTVSLRCSEQAPLRGLIRFHSGGSLGVAPTNNILLRWVLGAWSHPPPPRRGFGSHFKKVVGGIFGGERERATGVRMVLVGVDDDWWMCCSWSSPDGFG
jgi:hypothetical protein